MSVGISHRRGRKGRWKQRAKSWQPWNQGMTSRWGTKLLRLFFGPRRLDWRGYAQTAPCRDTLWCVSQQRLELVENKRIRVTKKKLDVTCQRREKQCLCNICMQVLCLWTYACPCTHRGDEASWGVVSSNGAHDDDEIDKIEHHLCHALHMCMLKVNIGCAEHVSSSFMFNPPKRKITRSYQ